MGWFVDKEIVEDVMDGVLIEEDQVECRPEKVPNAVLDENVDIHLVRSFFTEDAWLIVEDVLRRKQQSTVWICHVCQHDLHEKPSIICDACLYWYHFECVGITAQPKRKNWFCRSCSKSS